MPTVKHKPRVGDTCWLVEWVTKLGLEDENHPEYGCNPDKDKRSIRQVATKEEAERLAREVYPQDQYGAVCYWPATFVAYDEDDTGRYPHAGFWEASTDGEYYEGE
jgi:hypothetical protein